MCSECRSLMNEDRRRNQLIQRGSRQSSHQNLVHWVNLHPWDEWVNKWLNVRGDFVAVVYAAGRHQPLVSQNTKLLLVGPAGTSITTYVLICKLRGSWMSGCCNACICQLMLIRCWYINYCHQVRLKHIVKKLCIHSFQGIGGCRIKIVCQVGTTRGATERAWVPWNICCRTSSTQPCISWTVQETVCLLHLR